MLSGRQTERASKHRTLIKKVHLYYKGNNRQNQGSDNLEIVMVAWLGSAVISLLVGNVVGTYYLKTNDEKWVKSFDKAIEYLDEAIKEIK